MVIDGETGNALQMAGKTKITKIYRWGVLGLLTLVLSFGAGGKAMAQCAPFPKFALWSELTHEFVRQYVDDKYGGDWEAYIAELERYQSKLKDIHDKGLRAGVTWRDQKVRLKGAKLAYFLKLVEQRLTVSNCLAGNPPLAGKPPSLAGKSPSIANLSTAPRGTVGNVKMASRRSKQCGAIPQVAWWKFKTHDSVIRYVAQKHLGNWQPYIDKWSRRLVKLKGIYARKSGAVVHTGTVLRGQELSAYISQMERRNSVVRCLAN